MITIEVSPLFDYAPTKSIKECMHDQDVKAAGHGYALCGTCGALLPDEDPDLQRKCMT